MHLLSLKGRLETHIPENVVDSMNNILIRPGPLGRRIYGASPPAATAAAEATGASGAAVAGSVGLAGAAAAAAPSSSADPLHSITNPGMVTQIGSSSSWWGWAKLTWWNGTHKRKCFFCALQNLKNGSLMLLIAVNKSKQIFWTTSVEAIMCLIEHHLNIWHCHGTFSLSLPPLHQQKQLVKEET